MRKRSILIILVNLLIYEAIVFGQVTNETVTTVAENFFFERTGTRSNAVLNESEVFSAFPGISVMNMLPQGWVIVSRSEKTIPVLAYSLDGTMDDRRILPPAMLLWLESYNNQIEFHENQPAPIPSDVEHQWSYYSGKEPGEIRRYNGRSVDILLRSDWDQDKYYNELCPPDPGGPGGRCLAGCVATCMGQVMNYFQWPPSGTGSYTYQCPGYGTLSADFGNSAYNWDLMEPGISHPNHHMAEILNHLGISVDMEYGPDGSGMYNHKAAFSLRTYFKYLPTTEYIFRDSTLMDWDSILVSHLDRNIPMYYAGWSVPDVVGHAFVCDGYQEPGYYHFNFGWSGLGNDYFYTDDLSPLGNNFNLAQEVIVNAVPDTINYNYPLYCQDTTTYTTSFGTLEDGSGPLYNYDNNSNCHWIIDPADSVNSITLDFLRFSLATEDSMFVYDGMDETAPLLAALTGSDLPDALTSSGTSLFISFKSDNDNTDEGWLISYSSDLPVYCSGMPTHTLPSDTLEDGSGNFDYHNNSSCLWAIEPEFAGTVTLFFNHFNTEEFYDNLKIYDKETQDLLAEYSGDYTSSPPDPVTSTSGKMFLVFKTNYTVRAEGWEAYYVSDYVGVPSSESVSGNYQVSPVPAVNNLKVVTDNQNLPAQLSVYTLTGISIRTFQIESKVSTLNLKNIPPGIYILKIHGEQDNHTQKLIIGR